VIQEIEIAVHCGAMQGERWHPPIPPPSLTLTLTLTHTHLAFGQVPLKVFLRPRSQCERWWFHVALSARRLHHYTSACSLAVLGREGDLSTNWLRLVHHSVAEPP
jgi:hypothetical protein